MARLLLKQTLDFADVRVRETPLFIIPHALIVGVEDGSSYKEILDAAYLIQYPFVDGFGFVKGEYFKLSNGFNLLSFQVHLRSKFRLLPLRKQRNLTVSFFEIAMPLSNPSTPSSQSSTSAAATTVPGSTSSQVILAANAARKGATVYNASTATLYLDLEPTASTSTYSALLVPGGYYEVPFGYTGVIAGVWSAANGNALVRELT